MAPVYHPRNSLFLCSPGLQAPCWFGWRWLALLQHVGSRRLTHCSLIVGPAGVRRREQMPSWAREWKTSLPLISIWWNLPEAGQCPLLRDLSFTVPSWSMCLGMTKFCTILGKEIFLWQEATSVGVLCYDLLAESLILCNRKRIDGTRRWRGWDFEGRAWPYGPKADKPRGSAGGWHG